MANADSAKPAHDERRVHPRYKYVKPMQVAVAGRVIKGYTYDIGQGGVSFILDALVSLSKVRIEIPEANLTLEGRIINNQPDARQGLYRHQMQFTEILGTIILENILS